jgi:hypothetical protein
MADQIFMFMLVAGTMIGLGVLLFVSKGLRVRSARSIENELPSTSAAHPPRPSSQDQKHYDNKSRKAKKYTSDGKPVYED